MDNYIEKTQKHKEVCEFDPQGGANCLFLTYRVGQIHKPL